MRLPNVFTIENISIITRDFDVQVTIDNLNNFEVYESINKKGITARLSFLDKQIFEEILPIVGGEKVSISLMDSFKNSFNYNFIVSRKLNVTQRDETNFYNIELYLIEEKYFDILTSNYNYGIVNNTTIISDIIYKVMGKTLGSDFYLNTNKTIPKIIPNIYFPIHWKVDDCLDYLLENSVNDKDSGFYFIYDRNNDEFKITSLMELKRQNSSKAQERFTFSLFNKTAFNYIIKRQIVENNSSLTNINDNILTTKMYNFDVESKKLNILETNFDEYLDNFELKRSTISVESFALSTKNNKTFEYKPYIFRNSQIVQKNNEIVKQIGTDIKLEIVIDGRLELSIGNKIIIDHPSKVGETNSLYGGEWIVFNIDHIFMADSTYRQRLLIIKDYVKTIDGIDRIMEK